jgi:hypothetical protein
VPQPNIQDLPRFQQERRDMENETVVEIFNVWKIFGNRSKEALQAVRERGRSQPVS